MQCHASSLVLGRRLGLDPMAVEEIFGSKFGDGAELVLLEAEDFRKRESFEIF